jgi:hypothetical protein
MIGDVSKLMYLFWLKTALFKVLGEKVHFLGEKSTSSDKDFVFLD